MLTLIFVAVQFIRYKGITVELFLQPKQIMEIKDFLLTARRQDAKCKKNQLCNDTCGNRNVLVSCNTM